MLCAFLIHSFTTIFLFHIPQTAPYIARVNVTAKRKDESFGSRIGTNNVSYRAVRKWTVESASFVHVISNRRRPTRPDNTNTKMILSPNATCRAQTRPAEQRQSDKRSGFSDVHEPRRSFVYHVVRHYLFFPYCFNIGTSRFTSGPKNLKRIRSSRPVFFTMISSTAFE